MIFKKKKILLLVAEFQKVLVKFRGFVKVGIFLLLFYFLKNEQVQIS